ncbi:CENP-B N-terminal DNA-binding domain [Popillia japonica]|uniref:CENP-B N-terminal DNA-binding domain n=1 Tax=Popillia japonica TaxID=7064 RepID=A0AAW1KHW9_POPJA
MPGGRYKRNSHFSWTEENMQCAVKAIQDKVTSIRNATKMFGVPYGTLQDRMKGRFDSKKYKLTKMFGVPYGTLQDRMKGRFDSKKYKLGRKPVFTVEQEAELTNHIIAMSKLFYGLTPQCIRQLAYQFAEERNLPIILSLCLNCFMELHHNVSDSLLISLPKKMEFLTHLTKKTRCAAKIGFTNLCVATQI